MNFRPGQDSIPNQIALLDTSTNKAVLVEVIDKCADQKQAITIAASTTGATTFETTFTFTQTDLSKCEARIVVAPELKVISGGGTLGVTPADYSTILATWELKAKRQGERCDDLQWTSVEEILVQSVSLGTLASGRVLPGLNTELAAYLMKCWPAIAYTQDDVIEVTLRGDAPSVDIAAILGLTAFRTSSDPAGYPCAYMAMRYDGEQAWPVKYVQEIIQRYPQGYQRADLAAAVAPPPAVNQGIREGLGVQQGIQ